jgi:hypothetical protein
MTLRSSLKVSQVQIKALSQIVELTDKGFTYTSYTHDKRFRTVKALERRGLVLVEPFDHPCFSLTRVHPTPHGREMLHYLR